MAHLAAINSLMHTISRINHYTQVSLLPRFPPSLDSLYEEVVSLQSHVSESSYGKNWNGLDEELRELTCEVEDFLESHVSDLLILSGSGDNPNNNDLAKVEEEIRIFIERVAGMKRTYSRGKWAREQADDSSAYSSRSGFFTEESSSELVGTQDELGELKKLLLTKRVIKIVGMAGIGKTALAKAVIEDPQVWNYFDYHIFVPVGPNCERKELLLCIMSQMDHEIEDDDYDDENCKKKINHDRQAEYVHNVLRKKRCIILFDDVWTTSIDTLVLFPFLPDNFYGSCLMLTTRSNSVGSICFPRSGKGQNQYGRTYLGKSKIHKKQFLDKKESWDLLRKKVFNTNSCPHELKEFGRKIAEKCEGLPLAIISVGNHLAKAEKTVEYWECLAEKGIASIISADDEAFKVLHPSYQYLPLHLKALFLYLGVFPQYREISCSKIAKLWLAECIIGGYLFRDSERDAQLYLNVMHGDNLVVVKQHRLGTDFYMLVKTCSLHIVYWCYCKTQARKENLFQILNTIDDLRGLRSKRRLCIHNNSLFGIKDFQKSMESVTDVRSLLCTGPYHKYRVSISLGLKLLTVLDAVEIRFYEFPFEVLDLVLLRYFAFTYDGNIPPSISRLISLRFFIVRRHVRIIDPRCPSYLPLEIWDMKELRHLQVTGSDLPEPPPHLIVELPNLLKLLDVTPQSCTKRVLDKIPKLRKLGVQIFLPVDGTKPPCSLDHLGELSELKSLSC